MQHSEIIVADESAQRIGKLDEHPQPFYLEVDKHVGIEVVTHLALVLQVKRRYSGIIGIGVILRIVQQVDADLREQSLLERER